MDETNGDYGPVDVPRDAEYVDPHPKLTPAEKDEARERIRAMLTPDLMERLAELQEEQGVMYVRSPRRSRILRAMALVMVGVLILAVGLPLIFA